MSQNCRLGQITEVKYFNVYQITNKVMKFIIKRPHQSHQKNCFQKLLWACLFAFKENDIVSIVQTKKEITIHNSILDFIYRLMKLINDYSVI